MEKFKGLTLSEVIKLAPHEGRRFRRAGEEVWHEIHEGKICRVFGGSGVRGLSLDDVTTGDWEFEELRKSVTASEILSAMREVVREGIAQNKRKSPIEQLREALFNLGFDVTP